MPDNITDKIRKLLSKAESTQFEEEAAAFFEKAQELMLKYAIEQEEVWKNSPGQRAKPIIVDVQLTGNNVGARSKRIILNACALNNRCRMWYYEGNNKVGAVCGFESDVLITEMLYTTLIVYMNMQMAIAIAAHNVRSAGEIRNFQINFMEGYANRIWSRLKEQRQKREANIDTTGMELVSLRKNEVDKLADFILGNSRGRTQRSMHRSNVQAYNAGREAGSKADLGGVKLGGNRKELR